MLSNHNLMMNPAMPSAHELSQRNRQKALQDELQELLDIVGPMPLVDLLLERAFRLRATDIHLDPSEVGLRVRLRVDGIMHDVLMVPTDKMLPILSRIKLMAGMDITEKRAVQDGRILNEALGARRDIRVGSGPTVFGERLVLRLMPDPGELGLRSFASLGFEPTQVESMTRHIGSSHGLILSVGPVGSGKSTTMYTALEMLNTPTESLVTIEDPVERRVPGVNQIQVEPKQGFPFPEALRGVLRQDPNVVMIGEIRDSETAHIAVRAGLSGVTVLSTMHATDTAATIDVFREFEVPPIFIADSMQAIVAQRLMRKVCPNCRATRVLTPGERKFLEVFAPVIPDDFQMSYGAGCQMCFGTGYHGRTGIFEILSMVPEVRQGILDGMHRMDLEALAAKHGFQSLEQSAVRKILAGQTTIDEMHRLLSTHTESN